MFLLIAKGSVYPSDLVKFGISHTTAKRVIHQLTEAGLIVKYGSPGYASVTPELLRELHHYIEQNPGVMRSFASGVVDIAGLDMWPEPSMEEFFDYLKDGIKLRKEHKEERLRLLAGSSQQ
jgi:hypothetical protein